MIRQIFPITLLVSALGFLSFIKNPIPTTPLPAHNFAVVGDTVVNNSGEVIMASFKFNDKAFEGTISSTFRGWAKMRERARYKTTEDKADYVRSLRTIQDMQIDSFGLSNLDSMEAPLQRNVYCKIPSRLQQLGDMFYCQLPIQTDFIFDPLAVEPNKKGDYNLEISVKNRYTMSVVFPENYVIEAKPEDLQAKMPKNMGSVQFMTEVNGNILQFIFRIQLSAGVYKSEEFEKVKELFDKAVAKKTETIIIRKKEPTITTKPVEKKF